MLKKLKSITGNMENNTGKKTKKRKKNTGNNIDKITPSIINNTGKKTKKRKKNMINNIDKIILKELENIKSNTVINK